MVYSFHVSGEIASIEDYRELDTGLPEPCYPEDGPYHHEGIGLESWAAPSWVRALKDKVSRFVKRRQLAIFSLLYLITGVLLQVQDKKLIDHTVNYPLVTMQAAKIVIFVVFSLIYVYCKRAFPDYMSKPFNAMPLVRISLLEITSSAMSAVGSTKTTGVLISMLGQITIPLTMLASYLLLGRRYNSYQNIAAGMIVFFVLAKEFSIQPVSEQNDIRYNAIYMAAKIPEALASCIYISEYDAKSFHIIKYQYFASGLRIVFAVPVMLLFMASQRTRPEMAALSGIWHDVKAGLACLILGRNTIVDQCGGEGLAQCDSCEGALKMLALYVFCSVLVKGIYLTLMVNQGSFLLCSLSAMNAPLSSIAFSTRLISGASTSKLEYIDMVCFTGIMFALIMYGIGSGQKAKGEISDLEEPMIADVEPSECSLFQRTPEMSFEF